MYCVGCGWPRLPRCKAKIVVDCLFSGVVCVEPLASNPLGNGGATLSRMGQLCASSASSAVTPDSYEWVGMAPTSMWPMSVLLS